MIKEQEAGLPAAEFCRNHEEVNKIAERRRRPGSRRVGKMLERKGMVMNENKLYRISREGGLPVRRRRG